MQAFWNGGFMGPFVDVDDFYTTPRSPMPQALEAAKRYNEEPLANFEARIVGNPVHSCLLFFIHPFVRAP